MRRCPIGGEPIPVPRSCWLPPARLDAGLFQRAGRRSEKRPCLCRARSPWGGRGCWKSWQRPDRIILIQKASKERGCCRLWGASLPVGSEAATKAMAGKSGARIPLVLTDWRRESRARAGFAQHHSRLPKTETNVLTFRLEVARALHA